MDFVHGQSLAARAFCKSRRNARSCVPTIAVFQSLRQGGVTHSMIVTDVAQAKKCTSHSGLALYVIGINMAFILQTVSGEFLPPMRAGEHFMRTAIVPSQPLPLSKRLHIGANDITNPADSGVAVDFVDAGLFLVKTILQGFDCDIESDFVPKFETVGDGLRG
jgi:hypothetical protein